MYWLILALTLLFTPFMLALGSRGDSKTKRSLRAVLLILTFLPLGLGFLNWESFAPGRTGYQIAASFPDSHLGIFFAISAVEGLLFSLRRPRADLIGVVANFINTVLLFAALIRLSSALNEPLASWADIGAVFAVLLGNVIALLLINKEDLMQQYSFARKNAQRSQSTRPWMGAAALVLALIVLGAYFVYRAPARQEESSSTEKSALSAEDAAVQAVRALPEVVQYLKDVPAGQVIADHFDQDASAWVVQVFEVKNGHTATFHWYNVNPVTGAVEQTL